MVHPPRLQTSVSEGYGNLKQLMCELWTLMHQRTCNLTQSQYSRQQNKRRKGNTMALLKHDGHPSHLLWYPLMECWAEKQTSYLNFWSKESASVKWDKPLGQITGWLRTRLSFAILRTTNLCLRWSCTKWRSGATSH